MIEGQKRVMGLGLVCARSWKMHGPRLSEGPIYIPIQQALAVWYAYLVLPHHLKHVCKRLCAVGWGGLTGLISLTQLLKHLAHGMYEAGGGRAMLIRACMQPRFWMGRQVGMCTCVHMAMCDTQFVSYLRSQSLTASQRHIKWNSRVHGRHTR